MLGSKDFFPAVLASMYSVCFDRLLLFEAIVPSIDPDQHREVVRLRGLCRQDRKTVLVDGWFLICEGGKLTPIKRGEFEVVF